MKKSRNCNSIFLAIVVATVFAGMTPRTTIAAATLFGAAHSGPNGPSTLYTIDPATGAATVIGPIGFQRCSAMDFDQSGALYAICQRSDGSNTNVFISINPITGAGTEIGPTMIPGFQPIVTDMSIRPSDNTPFIPTFPGYLLGTVNLATGVVTQRGSPMNASPGNGCTCGWAFAFAPNDTLYATVGNKLFTLDHVSGQATFVADMAPDSDRDFRINGADFQPATGILFGSLPQGFSSNLNRLVTINPTTGSVTVVGQTILGLDALAWGPSIRAFSCGGFDPPMDKDAVKVKQNRVLPLKAQLVDENGNLVTNLNGLALPVVQVMYTPMVGAAVDVTSSALSAGQGTDGNQFTFRDGKWQFNLKTTNYTAAGTYMITMVTGDSSQYSINPTCHASFVIE